MRHTALAALLAGAALPALAASSHQHPEPLPALGADLSATSVSGISSGGFMATQLATAYATRIKGAGVIAAGPYYCAGTYPARSLFQNATTSCMSASLAATGASGAVSLANARRFAEQDQIDPPDHLAWQRVYVFSGSSDRTVKTIVVDQVEQYYLLAGTPAANILYRKDSNAGHAIITDNADDVECSATGAPYINNCGFVQAHDMLAHLYGPQVRAPNGAAPAGRIVQFDQRPFIKGKLSSMSSNGYAYVPDACRSSACRVHVALHGCEQGARQIGGWFYRSTGYNEFADTNQLIIVYPQTVASRGVPVNPKGCWDFWGYSNQPPLPPFYAKGAPQMGAIMGMIERLGQPRSAAAPATTSEP